MLHRLAVVATALLILTISPVPADDELQSIKEGDFTVQYAPGLDSQARKTLDLLVKSVAPSIEIQKKSIGLLSDPAAISREMAGLLGAEEKADEAEARLRYYKRRAEGLVKCFTNARVIKVSEAIAKGGVDAGVIQIRYDKDAGEFRMVMDPDPDEGAARRSYFPVLVNDDGSIRGEEKMESFPIDYLGSSNVLPAVPIHETTGYLIAEELKLYHPLARWFNDGVSAWVARRLISRADPTLEPVIRELFEASEKSRALRDKVSFLSWTQAAFQNRKEPYFDPALETAHSQYAIELVTEMLGARGESLLPRIMAGLNYNPDADTNVILAEISKVTGKDAKAIFMNYVAADVRKGIESREAENLVKDAEKAASEKNWKEAADKLRRALAMNPEDYNARYNLAWIEKENGERLETEMQAFLVSRLLRERDYSFHAYAQSVWANYVQGRLRMLLGDVHGARALLVPVLQANPDDPDAQRAVYELSRLEAVRRAQRRQTEAEQK